MRLLSYLGLVLLLCGAPAAVLAQVQGPAPSRIFVPPPEAAPQPQPQQPQQQPQQQAQPPRPAPGTQAAQPAQPAPNAPAPATQPQAAPEPARLTDTGGFLLNGASLTEMIDIIARRLKINYILDPAVKGSVTIYTYGEVKPVDLMPLLETILRVNGAAIVKVGDLYRVVPVGGISRLPLDPVLNADPKTLPDDERMILDLVFLKYTTVSEIAKLIEPFMGEGAKVTTYDPANLLLIQDNARNLRRTMELLALFDSDTFAGQRVHLFEIQNSRPSELQRELETVFKAYALSDKNSAVKFIAVDRINIIIAVAPNPGIFSEVENWIKKLDIAVKSTAGAVNTYVYRLKYARSETVAMAIMALYTGNTMALASIGMMMSMGGGGMGGMGMGGMGMGGMYGGMGMGGMGMGGMGMGGMYPGMGGMGMGGMYGGMNGMYGAGYLPPPMNTSPLAATQSNLPNTPGGTANPDLTGSYLGYQGAQGQNGPRLPHVIPNPFDNTLLIQATPQEYEQITALLRQIDVAPRQVLIDAKIYEVDLVGAFSAGVNSYLQKKDTGPFSRTLNAVGGAAGVTLTTGALVLRSHELLAAVTAAETASHTRVISAPSIIATDSVPATLNVGEDVPVLTSQAVAGGVQQGGSSVFTNTVSNRSSGVTLAITARINSSGIVTLIINQNVSSPQAPAAGGIQSPSFSNRSFQTQITVQDGDTVAIGGIIQESNLQSSAGVPVLSHIPVIGAAFGAKSISKSRTELVVFLTPRVIYDANQMVEASDEIKSYMKKVNKLAKEQ